MRESDYLHETPYEHRKAYGQFFTPPSVVRLMAQWVLKNHPKTIVDPALRAYTRTFRQHHNRRVDADIPLPKIPLAKNYLTESHSNCQKASFPWNTIRRMLLQTIERARLPQSG